MCGRPSSGRASQALTVKQVTAKVVIMTDLCYLGRVKKQVFFKSPTQWVFWGFIGFSWFFGPAQEKIGKIIQKLSNLKP